MTQSVTTSWQPFEQGRTLGRTGGEGGTIIRDDEHLAGGRITLERDCLRVPYAITCGIYGWMLHTRFIADEPTALHEFEQMKLALAEILTLLPTEDDLEGDYDLATVTQAIDGFIQRFP